MKRLRMAEKTNDELAKHWPVPLKVAQDAVNAAATMVRGDAISDVAELLVHSHPGAALVVLELMQAELDQIQVPRG